jgi:hypothetical protein
MFFERNTRATRLQTRRSDSNRRRRHGGLKQNWLLSLPMIAGGSSNVSNAAILSPPSPGFYRELSARS